MPANVESMMSVRQMPWHREGTVLADYPGSWDEARKHAGLDWEPVAEPVYVQSGFETASEEGGYSPEFTTFAAHTGQPIYDELDQWKAIKRSDTSAVLAVTRDSRSIIGHAEMGEIVEAILGEPNVKWETAGVLEGGRSVWCLALLDEPIELPGDNSITLPYVGITNRHDCGGCTARATMVRVVCANTFRAAELEGERTGTTYTFRHTRNWRDHIEDARAAVTGARREIEAYKALATHLLGITVTEQQRELFISEFIPMPPNGLITERVAHNVEEARTAVRGILNGTTTDGVSYTAYGLVQAAGEYLDHVRNSRSWESRLNRTLLRPEPMKARAMKLVNELVLAA